MPSTPSSADEPRRPSRRSLIALVALSVAVPALLLSIVLVAGDDDPDSGDSAARGPCAVSVDGSSGSARAGDAAPGFTMRALDGTCHSLSDYRGRPVVLTFFASWCHPCEQEMPLLEAAAAEHGDRLQVLAVSYKDLRIDSEPFVERLGVTYPAFHDGESAVAAAYGVRAIPQTFFIDETGEVHDRVFGITSKDALDEPLEALLTRR